MPRFHWNACESSSFPLQRSSPFSILITNSISPWIRQCYLYISGPTQLRRLDIIQKISARVICSTTRDAHAAPLLETLQLHSLEYRRHKHIIRLVNLILGGQCHPALFDFFELNPDGTITNKDKARLKFGQKRFKIYAKEIFNRHSMTQSQQVLASQH